MANQVAPDHPKMDLLFYVTSAIGEGLRDKVQGLVARLAASRAWIISPPEYIDESDTAGAANDSGNDADTDDEPLETLGGVLQIYSTYPPHDLPREVDLAQLAEVEALIAAVQAFSRDEGLDFDFELHGEFIGDIQRGAVDEVLADGLVGEWRRHLGLDAA